VSELDRSSTKFEDYVPQGSFEVVGCRFTASVLVVEIGVCGFFISNFNKK